MTTVTELRTKEQVIQAAVQAGFLTNKLGSYLISPYRFEDQDLYEELETLYNLAYKAGEKAMRERAAKLSIDVVGDPCKFANLEDWRWHKAGIVAYHNAIRALEVSNDPT